MKANLAPFLRHNDGRDSRKISKQKPVLEIAEREFSCSFFTTQGREETALRHQGLNRNTNRRCALIFRVGQNMKGMKDAPARQRVCASSPELSRRASAENKTPTPGILIEEDLHRIEQLRDQLRFINEHKPRHIAQGQAAAGTRGNTSFSAKASAELLLYRVIPLVILFSERN
ncbi:MAG: hypothetical protein WCQ50_09150 [Spirochaetota bacterium]